MHGGRRLRGFGSFGADTLITSGDKGGLRFADKASAETLLKDVAVIDGERGQWVITRRTRRPGEPSALELLNSLSKSVQKNGKPVVVGVGTQPDGSPLVIQVDDLMPDFYTRDAATKLLAYKYSIASESCQNAAQVEQTRGLKWYIWDGTPSLTADMQAVLPQAVARYCTGKKVFPEDGAVDQLQFVTNRAVFDKQLESLALVPDGPCGPTQCQVWRFVDPSQAPMGADTALNTMKALVNQGYIVSLELSDDEAPTLVWTTKLDVKPNASGPWPYEFAYLHGANSCVQKDTTHRSTFVIWDGPPDLITKANAATPAALNAFCGSGAVCPSGDVAVRMADGSLMCQAPTPGGGGTTPGGGGTTPGGGGGAAPVVQPAPKEEGFPWVPVTLGLAGVGVALWLVSRKRAR